MNFKSVSYLDVKGFADGIKDGIPYRLPVSQELPERHLKDSYSGVFPARSDSQGPVCLIVAATVRTRSTQVGQRPQRIRRRFGLYRSVDRDGNSIFNQSSHFSRLRPRNPAPLSVDM